jgi:hypothetical protein
MPVLDNTWFTLLIAVPSCGITFITYYSSDYTICYKSSRSITVMVCSIGYPLTLSTSYNYELSSNTILDG